MRKLYLKFPELYFKDLEFLSRIAVSSAEIYAVKSEGSLSLTKNALLATSFS